VRPGAKVTIDSLSEVV